MKEAMEPDKEAEYLSKIKDTVCEAIAANLDPVKLLAALFASCCVAFHVSGAPPELFRKATEDMIEAYEKRMKAEVDSPDESR
jgi:hypothetical protein